jgi:hypothetical protein
MATFKDRDIEIDPRFPVPQGVVDVRQESGTEISYGYSETDGSENDPALAVINDGSSSSTPILLNPAQLVPIPKSFHVVAQETRITTDGRTVVDVTVEYPDVDGVSAVERRLTKI